MDPGVYAANPPYTVAVLETTADKFLKCLDSTPGMTFFSLVPAWMDAEWLIKLLDSKYLVAKVELKRGHTIRNYLENYDFKAPFSNLVLVLSNTKIEVDVNEIIEAFH